MQVRPFEIFEGTDCTLVISGIGKIAAATATSFLLSRAELPRSMLVLNVGTCTSPHEHDRNQLFQIERICDATSERSFIPEVLVAPAFELRTLTTFDFPVSLESWPDTLEGLGDMEGAGFAQAASYFLPIESIQALKLCTDILSPADFSPSKVSSLMEPYVPSIMQWAFQILSLLENADGVLTREDSRILEELCTRWRLTFSTARRLHQMVRASRLESDRSLAPVLDIHPPDTLGKHHIHELFVHVTTTLSN